MWSRLRLTRFILTTDWAEAYASVVKDYTGQAFKRRDLEPKRLDRAFGDMTADRVQMMAQLELLSRKPVGGRQLGAEYLAAHGAEESEADRVLLRAVEGTFHSLHDVLEVGPGDRMLLKDTIIGGKPVVLDQERMATGVTVGDILFVRLLTLPDGTLTTVGSVFTLPESLMKVVNDTMVPRLRGNALVSLEQGKHVDPRAGVAPLFCAIMVHASEETKQKAIGFVRGEAQNPGPTVAVKRDDPAPSARRSPWAVDPSK
jgi:hypothetical protein